MSADREYVQRESGQQSQDADEIPSLDKWLVVAASVKGTSHEEQDQPCQDAHYWRILPNGALIAAVADGAGSAPLGEVGAGLAVSTAVNCLAESVSGLKIVVGPEDDAIGQLLLAPMETAREALSTEAEKREVEPRDLATTLILLVATGEGIAVAQVGDGAAVAGEDQGNVVGVTVPQSGEYINETTFLTSTEALHAVQIGVWRGSAARGAIFSDGIQMLCLKMPEQVPHAPFFNPLFSFVSEIASDLHDETVALDPPNNPGPNDLVLKQAQEQLQTFLRSPSVIKNTTDDLTLLLFSLISPEKAAISPEKAAMSPEKAALHPDGRDFAELG